MLMLTTLITVALLHWVALVTPGPNVLLVAQLAAAGHRRSACYAAVGISVIALTWATLAILGVNAVFGAHPMLRLALQAAGGLYLCYLAVRIWRSPPPTDGRHAQSLSPAAAFRLGLLTNVTNPKTALFFGGVFATALPQTPDTSVLAAAAALVFFNAIVWHVLLAVGFSHPHVQLAYGRQRQR